MSFARAYELRARLRPLALTMRVKDCGRRPISGQPAVVVQEFANRREAWWIGVLKCGRQHSCPVCAARKQQTRREDLDRLMNGDPLGRWQMLTLTIQHHAGQSLRQLTDRLMRAWRQVRATRRVREIFSERVSASVRALEVTRGKNGWHPHIHLLLRTEAWSDAERAQLWREWRRRVPVNRKRGVVWSSEIESWQRQRHRYIGKLGAEIAGVAKQCKNGNLTPWQLAERAANHNPEAIRAWREYQEASKGRRVLEFDERAKALLECAPEKEKPLREWRADMFAEEFLQLCAIEFDVPGILWEVLETARHGGLDPPAQVRITIDDACERKAA